MYPDAFSPNGDNSGDLYEYVALDRGTTITLEIFNRWGSLVYETTDVGRVQWDGKSKGASDLLPVGTYFAVFTENGVKRTQTITLWY